MMIFQIIWQSWFDRCTIFKSDNFAFNWLYGRSGMNPDGRKVDIIKGIGRIFVDGGDNSPYLFMKLMAFLRRRVSSLALVFMLMVLLKGFIPEVI